MVFCKIKPPKELEGATILNVQMGSYKIIYSYIDACGKLDMFTESIKDAEKRLNISLERSKK